MLLTISTTHQPTTDLGYLLHKHPDRVQTFSLTFGCAHVFYPEASERRCTFALILDIAPQELVRRRGAIEEYVSDRPYVCSSFLSVAISRVLGTALSGRCDERPELANTAIPFEAELAVVRCRGGEETIRRMFEPLGYEIDVVGHPLDATLGWAESRHFTLRLKNVLRLADLLSHLYVLVPVLDDEKHYAVGKDEIDKLIRHGGEWLANHPEQNVITRRYLRYKASLVKDARLQFDEEKEEKSEEQVENPLRLADMRVQAIIAALKTHGVSKVADLGCGEGKLLRALEGDPAFTDILGMDVSPRALEIAERKLKRGRARLIQGALTYRDKRLDTYDAVLMEVVEHLDPVRLQAFEKVLFGRTKPRVVVVTTPNREYNKLFSFLQGELRHNDHRFEWTREEFRTWVFKIATEHGYETQIGGVGPEDIEAGPPTHIAVFLRTESGD